MKVKILQYYTEDPPRAITEEELPTINSKAIKYSNSVGITGYFKLQ